MSINIDFEGFLWEQRPRKLSYDYAEGLVLYLLGSIGESLNEELALVYLHVDEESFIYANFGPARKQYNGIPQRQTCGMMSIEGEKRDNPLASLFFFFDNKRLCRADRGGDFFEIEYQKLDDETSGKWIPNRNEINGVAWGRDECGEFECIDRPYYIDE